jgi:SAM-dependent methyltransferase
MGLYTRWIFPHLCDLVMSHSSIDRLRRDLLAEVSGSVLEIGLGTGLNLPHYPAGVSRLWAVDPGAGMTRLARRRMDRSGKEVDLHHQSAESLPFPDEWFDNVVSTWTMCSIPDASRALSEIHRVLRPGGRLLFLEHGLSDDLSVQRWQRRLNPIQSRVGDGCRLDLDIETLVRAQPFSLVRIDRIFLERAPRTHGTLYRGVATK